jgi:hypothetical protein
VAGFVVLRFDDGVLVVARGLMLATGVVVFEVDLTGVDVLAIVGLGLAFVTIGF